MKKFIFAIGVLVIYVTLFSVFATYETADTITVDTTDIERVASPNNAYISIGEAVEYVRTSNENTLTFIGHTDHETLTIEKKVNLYGMKKFTVIGKN